MHEPSLIALHGVHGAGKDTTFHFIQRWLAKSDPALSAVRKGFADKAKLAFARQFFPLITEAEAIEWVDNYKNSDVKVVVESPKHPSNHIAEVEFRLCIAQFATQGARQIYGDDHWVDQLLPTHRYGPRGEEPAWWSSFTVPPVQFANGQVTNVARLAVVADLRFENELLRIRELGGLNVKIRRLAAERAVIDEAVAQGRPLHDSELGLPDEMFDVLINNYDDNLENAYRRTVHLMNEIDYNGIASIKRGVPRPWRIL